MINVLLIDTRLKTSSFLYNYTYSVSTLYNCHLADGLCAVGNFARVMSNTSIIIMMSEVERGDRQKTLLRGFAGNHNISIMRIV